MFAIKITEENLDKIEETGLAGPYWNAIKHLYLDRPEYWYFISGYVSRRGRVEPFNIVPVYIMDKTFVYDSDKSNTDWDQIVRKEETE